MNIKFNDINMANYELLNNIYIKEYNINMYELEHKKTKCKIVVALNDDENKTFTIAFKTLPENEMGMPHIMEHSMLCGSKKYNVKDPFFTLVKTSLATFINAFTAPDTTMYPVSSANDKDFKNMTDVYLDAVFNPNFINNENILRQEGWHYEFDENNNMNVTGVVFNEMKGDLSTPLGVLEISQLKDVYPGTTYAHNYGGEPEFIINLTQEEFVAFYEKYYHPSNAIIYLYGDIDINERLEYIDRDYLSKYEYKNISYPNDKVDISLIKDGQYYYNDNSGLKNKSYISYNIGLNDKKENKKDIIIRIINYILFNKEGAIITDKLKKDGLGEDISCGFENGYTNGFISIVSKNIDDAKKDEFKEKLETYMKDVLEEGIPEKELRSAINMSYINNAEPTDGGYTRGIYLFLKMLSSYRYGFGIDNFIKYEDVFDELAKEDLRSKNNMIMDIYKEVYINPYYKNMTVVSPKANLDKELDEKINRIIYEKKEELIKNNKLNEEIQKYKDLTAWMSQADSEEDLASMPKLSIDCIDRDVDYVTYKLNNIDGKDIIYSEENVGGLVYIGVDYLLPDFEDFNDEDKYLLSIMAKLYSSLDTKNYSYKDLNTELGLYTGGFGVSILPSENKSILRFHVKTTKDNIKKSYELLNEIIYHTKFDDKNRILDKLKEMKISSNISIIENGHASTLYRAKSGLSKSADYIDKTTNSGIGFNMFINDIIPKYEKNSDDFTKALYQVSKKMLKPENMLFDVCMDKNDYLRYENETKDFINIASKSVIDAKDFDYSDILDFNSYNKNEKEEVFIADTTVNYVSRSSKSKCADASLNVLNNIVSYDYLFPKIRVEGGAYGQGIQYDRWQNVSCYSYRDPKLKNTDDAYKNIYGFLKDSEFSDEDIEENIIGYMKNFDTYPLPQEKHIRNVTCFLNGFDNTYINGERHKILDTDIDKIKLCKEVFNGIWEDSDFCAIITNKYEEEAKKNYKNIKKLHFD